MHYMFSEMHILSLSLTFCSSQLFCDIFPFNNNGLISDIISEGNEQCFWSHSSNRLCFAYSISLHLHLPYQYFRSVMRGKKHLFVLYHTKLLTFDEIFSVTLFDLLVKEPKINIYI